MANEVQQMTVGVTLEMENFQRQLLKLTLELEKLRRIDLGLDVNSINNINKVLQNLSGTINSVAKGSKTNIVDSGKLEKTASEAKKVSAELQTAAKAVKEYHASFENLLNTNSQSKLNANMKQVENAFSRAKKAMADAKLDSKELGLLPTVFSTFDIKQNSAALKEQLASVAKVNSKLQAQIADDTKATTTAKTTAEKQIQQTVQQSAKVQAEAIHQTVTDEKLRQAVVNQTKLLLTELRKIVAALGDASKKATGEASQGYEQQGKVIAELTAKVSELAKVAVQAEQTKQTAVNNTTKAYESQKQAYERFQKNVANAPNEAAYNANQQGMRKSYSYLAGIDPNTPVSEYMNVPYEKAIDRQIRNALATNKELQRLMNMGLNSDGDRYLVDKTARLKEYGERWIKAVDSISGIMTETANRLKSPAWNVFANPQEYYNQGRNEYISKKSQAAAERETAAITHELYQKQWDNYEKELDKAYIKAHTPDEDTLKKDYANIYTPTADEKKAEREAAKRVMLQNQAEEKAYEQSSKLSEKARTQKQVTLDRLEEAQRKYYEKIKGMQNDFQNFSKQGLIETDRQWQDLRKRYESHVRGMQKIADMANERDATGSTAGRISDMLSSAKAWQQYTPENRLESNRAARQAMLDNWDYFGNDRGFSAQISQLRQLKEAAWLDYKQGGLLGNPTLMDKSIKQLGQAKTIEQQLVKYMEEYNRVLGTTETTWGKFQRKLHSHLNWIVAGAALGAAFAIPYETWDSIVKTDEAMHNLGTVMRSLESTTQSGKQNIAAVREEFIKLNEAASKYGATNEEIIESARLWGRMYKDVDTVNVLTAQSAKLAVADNFSVEESTKAVEAAMFQFGLVAKDSNQALAYSNQIIDVYTKLSHNAGVSAQDLARGVERTGAVAHQAGMDFEFLTALIAQGTRATALSGQEIGNMLKTMIGSFRDKKSVTALEQLGISVKEIDSEGVEHFRSVQNVLLDVAVQAEATDLDLQKLFKGISGGKYQWSKAAAMFSDYKEIIKNWGLAVDSMGFTDEQVKTQMDSLSRRIQTLKTDMEGLLISGTTGGLTETLKGIVSALDGLLKVLDKIPRSVYTTVGHIMTFVSAVKVAGVISKYYTAYLEANKIAIAGVGNTAKGAASSMSLLAVASTKTLTAFKALVIGIKSAFARWPQLALIIGATEALGYAIEKLAGYSEETHKLTQETQDLISEKEQDIQIDKQRASFVGGLLDAHTKLTEAIADETVAEEKREKIKEDIAATEEELTKVLGKETVERLKQDGWTQESINNVLDAYKKSVEEKTKSLHKFASDRLEDAKKEVEEAKRRIELYKNDAKAFIEGNNEKIKAMNFFQRASLAQSQYTVDKAEEVMKNSQARAADVNARVNAMKREGTATEADLQLQHDVNQRAHIDYMYWKQMDEANKKNREEKFHDTYKTENYDQQLERLSKNNDEILKSLNAMGELGGSGIGGDLEGEGGDGGFGGEVFDPTNPSYKLENAADTLVSKQILGELQKQTALSDAQLSQLKHQIDMYGVTDERLMQMKAEWEERSKFRNDAVEELTKERDRLIAETGGMVTVEDVASGKISNFGSSGGGSYSSGRGDIDTVVNQMAGRYGVDAALIHAVIGRESSYNQGAQSDAGAIGLMQLMPDTAESLGVDPYDWVQNIEGGVKYLSQLLEAFGGDVRSAIAAYNAGPNAVREYGGVPPYSETQDYVNNVLADYENNKANSYGVATATPNNPLDIWDYIEVDDPAKIEGLTDEMQKKIAYFAKRFMDATGERLLVTSGKRDASDGVGTYSGTSLHNTGNAIDIGNDAIFGDRNFLTELAKAAGLNTLFEVTDAEQAETGATGPHVHLSNTGAEMPGHAADMFSSGVSDEAYRRASVNYTAPDMEEIYQNFVPANQWSAMSTKERADFFNEHKQEFADAEAQVAKLKQIENIQTKINSIIKSAYEEDKKQYKEFVGYVKQQADETIQAAEYAQQAELTRLGLAVTEADQSKLQWDVEKTKLDAYTHALGYLSDTTKEYAAMLNNVRKAQLSADQAAEKHINDRYTTEKEAYERLAKARDLAMGDMSDGANWFNHYGEIHFNALKDAQAEVERLKQKLDSLRKDTATKDKKAIEETQNALTEAMQKAEKVRKEFSQKINDGLYDIFDQFLFEGESIEDILKNLWKDLGRDALKILMHQDVGEGSFLTQLLGISKAKDDVNRLKSVQTEAGQLSTDLADNASSIEQTQGIINNEQNIANGTWQRLDMILQALNNVNNGLMGGMSEDGGGLLNVASQAAGNYQFDQKEYSLKNAIDKMGWHSEELNLTTLKQMKVQEANTKAADDNTRGLGQTGTIMTSLAGMVGGLFGNSKGGRVASAILGGVGAWFGLRGLKNGGWFDNLPKFANGGNTDGKISGAGTGRSDSILAYLANKGKFVMLSNGEYVINEKSAKALGYDTLDRLNHYAAGGSFTPTPYVPTLNQKVVDRTLANYGSGNSGLYRQNGSSLALMEKQNKMMAEQNDMLKNADGQQGASQIIVLNTHASSDDVMRALQENPRALQAILGRQQKMGFR